MNQAPKQDVSPNKTATDNTVLYTLAHDIKSPINQVRGLLVIARRMNACEELDDLLRMALESNKKLSGKVNELLDMNLRDFEVKPIDLEVMVQNIWQSLKLQADEAGVHMILHCSLEDKVLTNMPRLKSILQNLLENAIKYRDRDRSDPSVVVNCFQNDGQVIVKVSDNGIGIRPDETGKVFQARFQSDQEKNGHGLGLYLSRQNAVQLGGNLEVESTFGEGSTFTLTFSDRSHGTGKLNGQFTP